MEEPLPNMSIDTAKRESCLMIAATDGAVGALPCRCWYGSSHVRRRTGYVKTTRLVIDPDLGLEVRREFIAQAAEVIERADTAIEIECSSIDASDPNVLGMLVVISRRAQRRGIQVVLVRPPAPLLARLELEQLSERFTIRS
jgi:anti-anti-sigma regulatory factor